LEFAIAGMMTVFVFGNPDLAEDSLPLRILPALRKCLQDIEFVVRDPNEEWEIPDEFIAIDTVMGIDSVRVFSDLSAFANAPRVSLHDFDALSQLRYLEKLGKLKEIKIIGIPPTMSENEAVVGVAAALGLDREPAA
jgi:hypothetical protein